MRGGATCNKNSPINPWSAQIPHSLLLAIISTEKNSQQFKLYVLLQKSCEFKVGSIKKIIKFANCLLIPSCKLGTHMDYT